MPPRKTKRMDDHDQDGKHPIEFEDDGKRFFVPEETRETNCNEAEDDYRPPEKRGASSRRAGSKAATGATKVNKRSRMRTPDRLNAIPADVFLEIASYLQPLDILRMARTNRAWRTILMSKLSQPIWQAAESTIAELPHCPSDLNEPQYARLMFDNDCYVCGGKNVAWTSFELRVRLCNTCIKDNLVSCHSIRALRITESTAGGAQIVEGYTSSRSVSLEELVFSRYGRPHTRTQDHYVFKPDLDRMLVLMRAKAQCGSEGIDWAERRRDVVRSVWLLGVEHLKTFHASWRGGMRQQYDESYRRKREKQSSREAEISRRLLHLGYSEVDIHFSKANQSHLQVAHALTESAWGKIRPSLETEVIENRDKRLESERLRNESMRRLELEALYARLPPLDALIVEEALTSTPVKLRDADFYNLPCIYPLWHDRSTALTEADWPSLDVLLEEMASFCRNVKNDLQTILRGAIQCPFPDSDEEASIARYIKDAKTQLDNGNFPRRPYGLETLRVSPPSQPYGKPSPEELRPSFPLPDEDTHTDLPSLEDPNSVFLCSRCHEPLRWPTLLSHSHVPWEVCPPFFNRRFPWSPDFVYTFPIHMKIMAQLIATSKQPGNDPSLTTRPNALEIDCCCCTYKSGYLPRKWRNYAQHVADAYLWERLAAEVKAMQDRGELTGFSESLRRQLETMIDDYTPARHVFQAGGLRYCKLSWV